MDKNTLAEKFASIMFKWNRSVDGSCGEIASYVLAHFTPNEVLVENYVHKDKYEAFAKEYRDLENVRDDLAND